MISRNGPDLEKFNYIQAIKLWKEGKKEVFYLISEINMKSDSTKNKLLIIILHIYYIYMNY